MPVRNDSSAGRARESANWPRVQTASFFRTKFPGAPLISDIRVSTQASLSVAPTCEQQTVMELSIFSTVPRNSRSR
jgi:hypothetical protein